MFLTLVPLTAKKVRTTFQLIQRSNISQLAKVTPDVEHITLQYYNINYNILNPCIIICMFTLSRHHFFRHHSSSDSVRFHNGFMPVAHVSALSSSNTSPEATWGPRLGPGACETKCQNASHGHNKNAWILGYLRFKDLFLNCTWRQVFVFGNFESW